MHGFPDPLEGGELSGHDRRAWVDVEQLAGIANIRDDVVAVGEQNGDDVVADLARRPEHGDFHFGATIRS
jgi:hypothetical protein